MKKTPLQIRSFVGTHGKEWEDEHTYRHSSLEITVVLQGEGLFRCEGREHLLKSGHVVLIPSDVPHSFHALKAIRFGVILVDGMPRNQLVLFHRLAPEGIPGLIALSKMDADRYESLFREWLRVLYSPLKEPERTFTAWVELLLLFLLENAHRDSRTVSAANAGDFIRGHLHQEIKIARLAEQAGLSEEGFRKQFMKYYQCSPKQYQQQCRLAEAKWLLSSTDLDLQSIAEAVGFTRLHVLSAWFKAHEGVSPTEWRKTQRLNHG